MQRVYLDEDRITATFDLLVKKGFIFYGPCKTTPVNDNGIEVSDALQLLDGADANSIV